MPISQTVEIPADHRLLIEVPEEVPAGKTVLIFRPAAEVLKESVTEKLDYYYRTHDSRLDDGLKNASHRLLAEVNW